MVIHQMQSFINFSNKANWGVSVIPIMNTQSTTSMLNGPSLLTPSAVLEAVTRLVAAFPSGIACHPSEGALHQIIEEMPATLDLAHGELIAIAPEMSNKIETITGLATVAWHFTDEDGRVHVTLSGSPELRVDGTGSVITSISPVHQAMLLADSEHLLSPNVLATRIRSIRLEVPSRDLNLLIEVSLESAEQNSRVALAS